MCARKLQINRPRPATERRRKPWGEVRENAGIDRGKRGGIDRREHRERGEVDRRERRER